MSAQGNPTVREEATKTNMTTDIHICVLIDALGWKLLEEHHFLPELTGWRGPVRTVLGYSSGAIPAILTGRTPRETGHWNLFYFDPKGSPFKWLQFLRFFPDGAVNHRVGCKIVKELGRRVMGLGSTFECFVSPRLMPWFNWVERKDIYEPGGVSGAPTFFDELTKRNVPWKAYTYHHFTDEQTLELAKHDIENGSERVYFLYLSDLDHVLHDAWGDRRRIQTRLDSYAEGIRSVLAEAQKRNPNARISIFSDHGMTPVEHRYDLVTQVEKLGLRQPEDYLAVYDSTMARYWFFNETAKKQVVDLLSDVKQGHFLSDHELKELGILFDDRRYGELIFLMDPGWLLTRSDFHGSWMPIGMHGYHPDDPYSDAVFLSNQKPARPVLAISDVYHCLMEAIAER
jgi:predicted AlkP superfamily pyrophosphatase or phosphodiesterase